MSQDVESIYEEYISRLKKAMPNVDPGLVHRIMYLERKLAYEDRPEPDVSAGIAYKAGSDVNKKMASLRSKSSVEAEHGDKDGTVHIVGRMKMAKFKEIASDMDVLRISGKVDSGYGE